MRPYQPPPHFWRISKYLFPSDFWRPRRGRVAAPREQTSIDDAATDDESISIQRLGAAEQLRRFDFPCYTDGAEEIDCVLPRLAPEAYVAQLKRGRCYGRHCTVLSPQNQVIRESAFFLDPKTMDAKALLGRYGLRHWRYRLQVDLTSRRKLPPPQYLAGSVATLNMRCSHNYFHWLTEILPRLATLKRAGVQCDHYLVDCQTPLQRAVLLALGLRAEQLIQPHCQLLLEADELVLPSLPSPECMRTFGSWAAERLGCSEAPESSRRIYISRRKAGTRRLGNEQQLLELLAEHNFETHCFEDYDLRGQCRLIREAEVVVATHGAGLANLVFARPGAQVIEIFPDGRYNPTCYPNLSRTFGLNHQIVFAQRAPHKQILRVSLDDARRALERALSPRPRRRAA